MADDFNNYNNRVIFFDNNKLTTKRYNILLNNFLDKPTDEKWKNVYAFFKPYLIKYLSSNKFLLPESNELYLSENNKVYINLSYVSLKLDIDNIRKPDIMNALYLTIMQKMMYKSESIQLRYNEIVRVLESQKFNTIEEYIYITTFELLKNNTNYNGFDEKIKDIFKFYDEIKLNNINKEIDNLINISNNMKSPSFFCLYNLNNSTFDQFKILMKDLPYLLQVITKKLEGY